MVLLEPLFTLSALVTGLFSSASFEASFFFAVGKLTFCNQLVSGIVDKLDFNIFVSAHDSATTAGAADHLVSSDGNDYVAALAAFQCIFENFHVVPPVFFALIFRGIQSYSRFSLPNARQSSLFGR